MAPRQANQNLAYKQGCFTPNFPSFPSGHASMAGGCFGMLRLLRRREGDRLPALTFISDELDGISIDHLQNRPRPYVPRQFNSISDIIEDCKVSRVYLGVHWRFDCEQGAESGERIAQAILERAYRSRRRDYHEQRERPEPYPKERRRYPEVSSR